MEQPQNEGRLPKILCTIISIFTILTLIIGLLTKNPFWVIAGIIPTAIYEAWRTEGYYTKIASVGILGLVILEMLAILNIFRLNLANTFQQNEIYFRGNYLPLGDIKFVFPAICVILSLTLITYTYGKYTKWLSILLLASSICLLFLVNRSGLIEIIRNFNFYYY